MYDSSCDGVWLMQKVLKNSVAWDTGNDYSYAESSINTWLNSTYLNYFGNAKAIIKNVKIPYAYGSYNDSIASGSNGLSCKVFLLSNREVGNTSTASYYANDGKKLAYFDASGPNRDPKRIAYTAAGDAQRWWLRSAHVGEASRYGGCIDDTGNVEIGVLNISDRAYARPCFIIPNNTQIDSDNNIIVPDYLTVDNLSIGDSVYANVDGTRTEFLIVHNGNPDSNLYDSSCNGVWCLMKDCYTERQWDSSDNAYYESSINSYLQNTFYGYFDSSVKSLIKDAKIPYCSGRGSSTVNTWPSGNNCHVFLLSGYEVGYTTSTDSSFPADGAKLDYFESGNGTSADSKRIANYNGSATHWWLRSPMTINTDFVYGVYSNGRYFSSAESNSRGIRPAFILPHTAKIDSNNNIIG